MKYLPLLILAVCPAFSASGHATVTADYSSFVQWNRGSDRSCCGEPKCRCDQACPWCIRGCRGRCNCEMLVDPVWPRDPWLPTPRPPQHQPDESHSHDDERVPLYR